MRACPRCGAENPPAAAFCGACGAPFAAPAARLGAQTMLGVASPLGAMSPAPAPPPPAPAAPPPSQLHPSAAKTMMGVSLPFAVPGAAPVAPPPAPPAPPVQVPAPPPAPITTPMPPSAHLAAAATQAAPFSVPASLAAAPAVPQAAPVVPQAPPAPPPVVPSAGSSSPAVPSSAVITRRQVSPAAQSTLETPAPPAPLPAAPSPGAPKGRTVVMQASPFPAVPPKGNKPMKTMVMQAPVVPPPTGQSLGRKTLFGFRAPEPEMIEEWYDEVVPETGEVERRVRVVEKPLPPVYKRPAFFLILGAVALLGVGTVAAVMLKSSPPLTVEPRVDATGKDQLRVRCDSCPDGTTVAIAGGTPAPVKGAEADLTLPAALKIGDNHLAIAVDRPAGGRDETVEVDVRVAYRVWPELGGLQDPAPAVRVLVEAVPGATVTVAGKPVVLGADGRGTARVDVAEDLGGLSREAKMLAREIAYTVAAPGAPPATGKLDIKLGIAPLVLDSPGLKMTTDQPNFTLAGRTLKGGGLLVAGRPISVTPEGTFSQLMNISSVGATNVELRATAPNLAPRIATITVKRVASLAQEMKVIEAELKVGFADVAGKEPSGVAVAWRGEVVSASQQGHLLAAVIDVGTGCAKKPCRARFTVPVTPGALTLASGDKVFVHGKVTALVDAGDAKLPSIEAEFAVKNP